MKTMVNVCNYLIIIAFFILISSCTTDNSPEIQLLIEDSVPITDFDGNVYKTVEIGDQIWTTENLNVSHFQNGDPIPKAETKEEWVKAGSEQKPAWCYYNNDPENGKKYGKLYNWYAINDSRGLAPKGWIIPNNAEWGNLINNLAGNNAAGTKMKSLTGWYSNGNGDNSSRFTALPGGGRVFNGDFTDINTSGVWWSSLEQTANSAWGYNLNYSSGSILQGSFNKSTGLSVRCIKCSTCSNDSTTGQTLSEKLQKALDLSLSSSRGKGVSAAIILPNGETWTGVSGISHGSVKVTPNMRFSAGSIEKMFAATTILQLAEEGKLKLDDSLQKWLPTYQYIDNTITIRQLLNHTSGLPNYVKHPDFWKNIFLEPTKTWTLEGMILAFIRPPLFPKGMGWNYSQTGYNLLRMIIKKITGSEISTVNKERFFTPLGLSNTFTSMGEDLPSNIVHSWYDVDKDGNYDDFFSWPRTAFASGIGGEVWCNAEDLAKWIRALLQDKKVVNETSLKEMLTFHSPCTGEESVCSGYGLAVIKFNPQMVNGLEAYGHGGNAPGFAAGCIYLPLYQVCIGILDNTEEGEAIGTCLTNLIKVITSHFDVQKRK